MRNLGNIDRKYTKLPLDEPYFEINANTRAILIPNEFKKNGIAVQGDDLAEIIYFKIDRYFDYMDLNNCEIYIQWELPKGNNGQSIKSVSPAYIRDIESEPGKLIFGWAISDAITAQSGSLKFSVKFFEWDKPEEIKIENNQITSDSNKKISYSFNTLTATVNIQPGINFNPETEDFKIDDCGDRLIERLENSEIVGGYVAAIPEFITNIDDTVDYDLDLLTEQYELLVQATAADTGVITYTWKRQGLNSDNTTEGQSIETFNGSSVFVKVEDENLLKLDKAYTYYQMNGDKPIKYNNFITNADGTLSPNPEDLAKENFALFIKQSQFMANNYGVYWAVAENRITNSSSTQISHKATFPRPEEVVITVQPDISGILDAVDQYDLSVVSSNNDGILSYQWQRNPHSEFNYEINEADFENIIDAIADSYTVNDEEGRYRVIITNTRNKDSKSLASNVSRITKPAKAPIIEKNADTTVFNIDELTAVNCPTIKINPTGIDSDYYIVNWYLIENTAKKLITDIKLTENILVSEFNPKDYEAKILEVSTDDTIEGTYKAIVVNYYNGSAAESEESEEFFIIKN